MIFYLRGGMSSIFKKYAVTKPQCTKCKLDKGCHSPRMAISGEGKKGILVISGAPCEEEDKQGTHLIGDSGSVLRDILATNRVHLDKDCWKINAVNCAIGKEPTAKHVKACRPYVKGIIKQKKPSKIFLLGDAAISSFYLEKNSSCCGSFKMNGLKLWDDEYQAWVFPLWHPSTVRERKFDSLMKAEYKRCVTRAVQADSAPLKKRWNPIHCLSNFKAAKKALANVLSNEKLIAIDYETTGLDMYKDGHSTVSFAWATDKGAWAVPVQHPTFTAPQQKEIYELIQKILKRRKIKKIVQGINFEYPWTKRQLKVEPRGFFWDTQLATHVIDNRGGITPLKFQTFVRWGITEYDTLSKQYIKSNPATGFNDMLKMPVDALLEYNAFDALYTYELYLEQLKELLPSELEAYHFLHRGAIALCEMSINGISIKKEYYLNQRAVLEQERNKLLYDIEHSREAELYRRKYGVSFDHGSNHDMQKMLFKVLKLTSHKQTKTGESVDADVLTKVDIQLTRDILAVRKLNKMMSTYVDGFLKHTHNGEMHASFSLARVTSYRSSSQNPNFQNTPKRDPKAKRITRSGMVPRVGNVLGEMDFSGAEISTSCYYHQDPTFIEYQTAGVGDMHKDACAYILKIDVDDVPKECRQATKGIWTFSQFYGSYYVSCAKQGWEEYPQVQDNKTGDLVKIRNVPIDEHMQRNFVSLKSFEGHLKAFENKFWNEWFPVYTQWKKDVTASYEKTGYVETFLGFRFKGYMDRKQCTNFPVQGTSFHLLLHTAAEFISRSKKAGLKTLCIGQIHDSLILDIPVGEIEAVHALLKDIVTGLSDTFSWMSFPMGLDFEISKSYEQGGSFASMEKI